MRIIGAMKNEIKTLQDGKAGGNISDSGCRSEPIEDTFKRRTPDASLFRRVRLLRSSAGVLGDPDFGEGAASPYSPAESARVGVLHRALGRLL